MQIVLLNSNRTVPYSLLVTESCLYSAYRKISNVSVRAYVCVGCFFPGNSDMSGYVLKTIIPHTVSSDVLNVHPPSLV